MPNASTKAEEMYDALREQGNSKEKAARISNAAAASGRSAVGEKGGRSGSYDSWTVLELRARAKELGITGYSGLNKSDLIYELREH
jgi:Rho termination factor, N-terminal domain